MKIDFDAPILDAAGKPCQAEEGKTATLGSISTTALLSPLPGDESQSGAQKAECGLLGLQLYSGGEQDLRAEQVTLLKERIGRGFPPLVVARTWALLDPPGA